MLPILQQFHFTLTLFIWSLYVADTTTSLPFIKNVFIFCVCRFKTANCLYRKFCESPRIETRTLVKKMTTLIPTSQQQQATASVAAPAAGVESYEDMFKEITRKLYGDESAHGLYPINNAQVAQLAQTPSAPPEG